MSKIFTNFYAIILLSFYVTEDLPIPTPKGIKIPTLHEDCVILSQLIFSSFDIYYSVLENVIISLPKEISDDYKINNTFQQTCTYDGIVFNPNCQIEDVPIVTTKPLY
ncbi:15474_t:CDS:2 [Funneliformis mosseae]|uniref:15474_t:CDS:1 n=1 Tax=Funneliformis mosseae TaxID=27381 RepID=A0A9N9D7Q4_FUNMO|nr:15474_t:CDS:2 [Funneliformis mosseae]